MKKQRKPPRSKRAIWKMKLTSIFFPFLLSTAGSILLYMVLYWYSAYQVAIASPQFLSIFLIVIILLATPLGLMIKKRLNLLESRRFDIEKWLELLAMITVFVPGLFIGEYIDKGVGKTTDLGSIKEITDTPATRFYTVDQCYANSNMVWIHSEISTLYKSSRKEIKTYCVVPAYSTSHLGSILTPVVWIGKIYKNPSFYPTKLEEVYSEFVSESENQLKEDLQQQSLYFESVKFTKGNGFYLILQKRLPESLAPSKQIVLIPHEGSPEELAEGLLCRASRIYCICSFIFLMVVLVCPVKY